jgi:hypothetical protein
MISLGLGEIPVPFYSSVHEKLRSRRRLLTQQAEEKSRYRQGCFVGIAKSTTKKILSLLLT